MKEGAHQQRDSLAQTDCAICGGRQWVEHYRGPVRAGRFGTLAPAPGLVLRCRSCDAAYLVGQPVDYASDAYRKLVDGGGEAADFHRVHDAEQAEKLALLGTGSLRGRCVADIGCGAGALLDLVRAVGARTLAVEPMTAYHAAMRSGGHAVFPVVEAVPPEWHGQVDLATCFSVLEHIEDPLAFLQGIRRLLKPCGRLLLSTPNRDDWLLELLPEDYGQFFYRVVHRWYFTAGSLCQLGSRAGFAAVSPAFHHRFDLSNFLLWLRDRHPTGLGRLAASPVLDATFVATLAATGRSDYLHAWLEA